jgi:hypothetical protein
MVLEDGPERLAKLDDADPVMALPATSAMHIAVMASVRNPIEEKAARRRALSRCGMISSLHWKHSSGLLLPADSSVGRTSALPIRQMP